jgi:predicted 2-oxoglutarate/Fe(II)-dependent dioxygenase YbiX
MFNSQLKDYVKVYSEFFSQDFCVSIVSTLDEIKWDKHSYFDLSGNIETSYENELSVSIENVPLKKELDLSILKVLYKYVRNDIKYMNSWFGDLNSYSFSRFNKYDPSTLMRLHCDHITTLFDGERKGVPILTVLGVLNEDYEGGEFMLCGERIELKTGDVIVFPSNFLYPHEVKPVKSGVRYSFVSWAW